MLSTQNNPKEPLTGFNAQDFIKERGIKSLNEIESLPIGLEDYEKREAVIKELLKQGTLTKENTNSQWDKVFFAEVLKCAIANTMTDDVKVLLSKRISLKVPSDYGGNNQEYKSGVIVGYYDNDQKSFLKLAIESNNSETCNLLLKAIESSYKYTQAMLVMMIALTPFVPPVLPFLIYVAYKSISLKIEINKTESFIAQNTPVTTAIQEVFNPDDFIPKYSIKTANDILHCHELDDAKQYQLVESLLKKYDSINLNKELFVKMLKHAINHDDYNVVSSLLSYKVVIPLDGAEFEFHERYSSTGPYRNGGLEEGHKSDILAEHCDSLFSLATKSKNADISKLLLDEAKDSYENKKGNLKVGLQLVAALSLLGVGLAMLPFAFYKLYKLINLKNNIDKMEKFLESEKQKAEKTATFSTKDEESTEKTVHTPRWVVAKEPSNTSDNNNKIEIGTQKKVQPQTLPPPSASPTPDRSRRYIM